jgi:hypothetical protein
VRPGSYVCNNWNFVLEEVKKNQARAEPMLWLVHKCHNYNNRPDAVGL